MLRACAKETLYPDYSGQRGPRLFHLRKLGFKELALIGRFRSSAPSSLCRAGVCGTCRTQVLSGDVQCASQMLDEQDRQDGFVLACVTRIESDCTVDA